MKILGVEIDEDAIKNYLSSYCACVTGDDIYNMDELEEILEATEISKYEAFLQGFHAYQYRDDCEQKQFLMSDDFVLIDGYGHLASMSTEEAANYVLDTRAKIDAFLKWLADESY